MAKRGRKPKNERKGYFYEEQEQAVIDYINAYAAEEKARIFNEILSPAFTKMVESIIRRYNLYVPEQDLIINEEVFFKAWVTQWLTTVARADLFVEICDITKNTFNRCLDVYLYFLLLQRGNGISLNQSMGIYRWTSTGASIGRTDVQWLQDGYSIGKNLYKVFPQKVQAKNRMKYYGIRLLGYCNLCNKIDRRFYKDNLHLLDSPKEQILAFLLFITPPFIWKFTRHIYSSFLFKD